MDREKSLGCNVQCRASTASWQCFLNLFTPSLLTGARRQHPAYPPAPPEEVTSWLQQLYLSHLTRLLGYCSRSRRTTPTTTPRITQKTHISSYSTHPSLNATSPQKDRNPNSAKSADRFKNGCGGTALCSVHFSTRAGFKREREGSARAPSDAVGDPQRDPLSGRGR